MPSMRRTASSSSAVRPCCPSPKAIPRKNVLAVLVTKVATEVLVVMATVSPAVMAIVALAAKVANAVAGMEVEAKIRDVRKRVIETAKFPVDVEKGVAAVRFESRRLSDGCSFLELRLLKGEKVLAESEPREFYRHVPRHDDYEIFADPCQYGGQQGDIRDAIGRAGGTYDNDFVWGTIGVDVAF